MNSRPILSHPGTGQHNRILIRSLNRLLYLILPLLLAAGWVFLCPSPARALGGGFSGDWDGIEIEVEYSDTEWGEGEATVICPTCGEEMTAAFHYTSSGWGDAVDLMTSLYFCDNKEHCVYCVADFHCGICGECMGNDVEECPECESDICLSCHEDSYFCDICGKCCLDSSNQLTGEDVDYPGIEHVCEECLEDVWECAGCGNTLGLGGESYLVYDETGDDWCPECELCRECLQDESTLANFGHCRECGVCGNEADVCDDCHLCEDCRVGESHCPECDYCFGEEVDWCPSGGDHCVECDVDNDWICEQCGECMEAGGFEFCDACGLCVLCCEENSKDEGCAHGFCVKSVSYYDHLCLSCGKCPHETACGYCGLCEDCQQDYHCGHEICPENVSEWEEHLCGVCGNCFELDELCEWCHMCEDCRDHCVHGFCPESIDSDGHFCEQCGGCADGDGFCGWCGLCKACCAGNTADMGCDHGICLMAPEFIGHYCFADSRCLEYCDHNKCAHAHVSSAWSSDSSAHWHVCQDCGAAVNAAAHVEGNAVTVQLPDPMTRKKGTARIPCSVCGETMSLVSIPYVEIPANGAPYIMSQPKDYEGRVSTAHIDDTPLWTELSLIAGGEGKLSYQWYVKYGDSSFRTLAEDPEFAIGTKTSRLKLVVDTDACNYNYQYYCVVTNAKGSATTRTVKINARHVFGEYRSNGASTHSYYCLGEGCEVTKGDPEPHRWGEETVVRVATSEQTGLRRKTCLGCGQKKETIIPKVEPGHVHQFTIIKKNSARHWAECECGKINYLSAHLFQAWQTVTPATETKAGREQRKCVCGEIRYRTIEKLAHTHDFTNLIDSSKGTYTLPTGYTLYHAVKGAYMLPNGYITEDYHVRYCATKGCNAEKKELHSYNSWTVTRDPSSSHPGRAYRSCTLCGHCEVVEFTGKWPILTEVFGEITAEGFGGALIKGPTAANAGEKVTLTVQLYEGYTVNDAAYPGTIHGWSLDEVTSTEGLTLYGSWKAYQNGAITDFKADGNTFTATFTMPAGPVALGFFPSKCDHKGAATYSDKIEPSCTVAGANVLRCSRCKGIAQTLSRIEPTGHTLSKEPIAGTEVRAFCSYTANSGGTYQYTDLETRTGYSGDFRCTVCSKVVKGKTTGVTHGIYGSVKYDPDRYPQYWSNVYEERDGYEVTCTKKGYTGDVYCKLCGAFVEKGEYEDACGHDWSEWTQCREATPKVKGQEKRTCGLCDITQVRAGDYSGPDYELKADKTKVHFDFTYGEKVEPILVTYESVGRDKISAITRMDLDIIGTDVMYHVKVLNKYQAEISIAYPALVMENQEYDSNGTGTRELMYVAGVAETNDGHDVTAPTVDITASVRKTTSTYKLTVTGGKAVSGSRTGSALELHGGDEFTLKPDRPADFVRWEITADASGMLAEYIGTWGMWMDWGGWTGSSPRLYMSPNNVTIKAVYKDSVQHPDGRILTVPAKTKTIREEAFMGTPFRWVKAGNDCKEIGARAFADCGNLVGIYLPKDVTFQKDTFAGSNQAVIYAPAGGNTQKLAEQYGIPFVNWQ